MQGYIMDLSSLSSIAQIAAAIGVIVSLAFLGYEIRMTRLQAEHANWRDLLQSLSDYKGITNDLPFAEFVTRAHTDYHALTDAEKLSFGGYMEQGIHIYANFYKHNALLPGQIDGIDEAISNCLTEMLATPGGAAWWVENKARHRFRLGTYDTIDAVLRTASGDATARGKS
jgi:hypothetical protein